MSVYCRGIQALVQTALLELSQEHQQGKLVNAPVSNHHFLVRWVTKSLKQQRFHRCVVDDLVRWQKAGRSQGKELALETLFRRIAAYYAYFFHTDETHPITDHQIESFLDQMALMNWEVSTAEPIVGCGKVQLLTEKPNSLALCADECESCFDGERLIKPMHWFVRGNHSQFIEMAWQAGLMVHKRTDYKSNVKYHGEYLIYPENQGEQLAEIPSGFQWQHVQNNG